jgi:dipeptidyl aminopeptidase/acylaminoacyl peptidase
MPLPSDLRFGPYEILDQIGEGGMGTVFRASDTRLGRIVAIKVLRSDVATDPQRLSRFEREARAASSLNHPNIVVIYEIGTIESQPYLVMEYVEGKTLREILSSGPVSVRNALRYSTQVASGLAKAHEAGIIHRDLKPENLIVNAEGLLKILDFGVAKLVQAEPPGESASAETTLNALTAETLVGMVVGTIGYMSPEQAKGQAIDFRSDQFSIGTILYEMITAKRAFHRATAVETLSAIIHDEPEPLSARVDVPKPLRWVIDRCLAKEPRERYGCTADLAGDLERVEQHQKDLASVGPSPADDVGSWFWWRLAAVALSVLLVIVTAWMGWKYLQSRNRSWPQFTQLTFRRGAMSRARFAPDGETVVYSAAWEGRPLELFTTRVGSPESRSLGIKNADIMAISSAGELAVGLGCVLNWGECHDATLARVPLAGGAPRQILEHVDAADWSPDGKELAVVHIAEGQYSLQFPVGKTLYTTQGWIRHPRISPQGDQIAFLNHPVLSEISGSVDVVDLAGRRRTLSDGWRTVVGLAWTGDGKEIWFTGVKGTVEALYAVDLAGHLRVVAKPNHSAKIFDISSSHRVLLARIDPRGLITGVFPDSTAHRDLSWFDYSTSADLSSDGKTLLFYEWGLATGGVPTAFLRETDGSDPIRLGECRPLALSPDGKWVVALQTNSPQQLMLLPTGAGEQRMLQRGDIEEFYSAMWFPDSIHIVFSAAEKDHQQRSYLQDITGGPPQPLTREASVVALLSPDAKTYAKYNIGGYSICPIGEDAKCHPIEGVLDDDILLRWSRDGRSIFVRGAGDFSLNIFRVDLASGKRQLWKQLTPPDPAGLIGIGSDPGQVLVSPEGTSFVYTYWNALSNLFVASGLD